MKSSDGTHILYHFVMDRETHESNLRNGVYPAALDPEIDPALTIRREETVTFSNLEDILHKVGGPYGWNRRREYHDPKSVAKITEQLNEPTSQRFTFFANNKSVGGVIIANVEQLEPLFDAVAKLNPASKLKAEDAKNTVEVYKIGLYPEHTDRGWGRHFFPKVLTELFKTAGRVYLNTRSTNHNGVVGFYTGQNMRIIHAQTQENDLLPRAEAMPSGLIIPNHGAPCRTP